MPLTIRLSERVAERRSPAPRVARLAALAVAALGVAACAGESKDAASSQDSAAAASAAAGGGARAPGADSPAATAAAQGGWVTLFDGSSLDAWRGYKRQDVPASWRIDGNTLAFAASKDSAGRGDLVTREQFGDFELQYEWKISPGGNSGVMWRVSEDQQFPWNTGPEQQVLDDDRHADGKFPTHRAGALYDLVAPPAGLTKPVGEFNQARIVAQGSRVQLFLNGRQTADVDFASDSGRKLLANSKFKTMPRFAQNATGHIVLQDHDDPVWYRDIRVRRLGAGQ